MDESLIVAREIPHGYTWTLASRLGDILGDAERFYGKRNKDFTVLGIEFCESGPRIWYPKSKDNIVIQLSLEALQSEKKAIYQLAHECIHLLSPSGKCNAIVLEEGLAVYHSWYTVEKKFQTNGKEMTGSMKYLEAGLLVEKVLNLVPDFFLKLRSLRKNLWEVTEADIHYLCPELTKDEVITLAMRFDSCHPSEETLPTSTGITPLS